MTSERFYITISRQFGSLGRPIAQEMSELLNIPFYDRDIVEKAAADMGLTVAQISQNEEQTASPFGHMALPLGSASRDTQDKVFDAQKQAIINLADRGSAIFVGRCADYILRDQKHCLNFFIYAPKQARYLNCINTLKMKPDEARKMIDKVDRARERYWLRYAKHTPDDPEFRHLMVDSSMFGVSGTASLLASVAEHYFSDLMEAEA